MLNIPLPPPPQMAAAFTYGGAAASVAVGAGLLLWGRRLHRVFLALVGLGVGLAVAAPVASRFGLNIGIARAVAMTVLAVAGLLCARIIWASLAGAVLGAISAVIILAAYLPGLGQDAQPSFQAADETFAGWLAGTWDYALAGFQAIWDTQPTVPVVTVGLAVGLPLLIGLLRGRLATIFTTALTGSAGVVAGGMIAAAGASTEIWRYCWGHHYIPAGILVAGLLTGLVFQYRSAIVADRATAAAETSKSDKDQTKAPDQAEK